ncbi:phage holin family protein [Persicimonas caeni]|jgi:uncharacterized membrane protein YqjE|uniref:Phage holin family protein n=1 Tax=Persicimonas caeni TaxID=2292766 RepID=A0A4Y6PXW3_PERCE|nr:phage holin family protein [Persicimonas caeni]QDG53162.1 phage holin family protein [Persicimonas caeni]QED34384.1 phage holin family protein [Persicimonas caeni]
MSELNRRRSTSTNGRRRPSSSNGINGLKPAFERLTDGLSTLVKQHLELARYELKQDVTTTGKRVAIIAVCAVIGLIGYVTLLGAGILLAAWLGGALAAFITAAAIAVVHLAVAGGLTAYFGKQLRDEKPVDLAQTNDELNEDKRWLREIGEKSRNGTKPKQLSQEELPPS